MFKAIPNQHLTVVDIAALNKQVYALTFAHTYMGSEIKYKTSRHHLVKFYFDMLDAFVVPSAYNHTLFVIFDRPNVPVELLRHCIRDNTRQSAKHKLFVCIRIRAQ